MVSEKSQEGIDLILDIPLEISVRLGLCPNTPQKWAGVRMEPARSLPDGPQSSIGS